jgi:hypothetical protein
MARMAVLCPKLILEGTRLTHKTDLAFALNEHRRIVGPRMYRYHSPLVSAEWSGLTNEPWGRGLVNFEPAEEALALEAYATWARLFELHRYYSWIVDRFHVSTIAYQRRRNRVYDFEWLERRLQPLGFRLLLCVRSPESFAAARAERLEVSGNPRQYDDLSAFIAEQQDMREIVGASRLPSLEVDLTDGNVAAAADRVADWLERTGGLHAPV